MTTLHAAQAAIQAGRMQEALTAIERLRAEDCDPAQYLILLGQWHMRQHLWEAALPPLEQACELRGLDYAVHYNLGYCLHKLGRFDAAAACYEQTLKLNPDFTKAWVRLGHVCLLTGHFAIGLACYAHAAMLDGNDQEARCGYGTGLSLFEQDAGAEQEYRRALAIDPAMVEAEMGLGFTLLRAGKWREGWQHRQAALRYQPWGAPWDYVPPPFWCGTPEELLGKRVILCSEQGFGDTIQFARYIPLVAELAAQVHLVTPPSLVRLMEGLGVSALAAGADLPEHDVITTLMSLPAVFETLPDICPPPARYLFRPCDPGARIGLCWHGSARPHDPAAASDDGRRSIPWDVFAPIAHSAPYVSLQEEDLRRLGVRDWADTAEIVAGLDLVITVDTAIAHLAGSLGIETWCLLRRGGCWRWMTGRSDTPWYRTMRLFRQPALGEWGPVVAEVTMELQSFLCAPEVSKPGFVS